METLVQSGAVGIVAAAALLRAGELVAFPTETVYGLGADARSEAAVRKIYEAKGRPAGNPLIVHVANVEDARRAADRWPAVAEVLAEKFWPGPLTLIVRRGGGITPLVSAGRETVALRCPDHPIALRLLEEFGGPIAAPSANRSGFTSPTSAAHVFAELAGRVPLILNGGECAIGLESTVLDISGGVPTILRPGAITMEMLREVVPGVRAVEVSISSEEGAASPGQHRRHYAPRTAAYRFAKSQWVAAQQWAAEHGPVTLLSSDDGVILAAPHETIRMPADEAAYGRVLYAALREADERGLAAILILAPGSGGGLWSAIADRIARATVPLRIGGTS